MGDFAATKTLCVHFANTYVVLVRINRTFIKLQRATRFARRYANFMVRRRLITSHQFRRRCRRDTSSGYVVRGWDSIRGRAVHEHLLARRGMPSFAGAFSGARTARISISVTVTFLVGTVHGNFRREAGNGVANIYVYRTSCSVCNVETPDARRRPMHFNVHHQKMDVNLKSYGTSCYSEHGREFPL